MAANIVQSSWFRLIYVCCHLLFPLFIIECQVTLQSSDSSHYISQLVQLHSTNNNVICIFLYVEKVYILVLSYGVESS